MIGLRIVACAAFPRHGPSAGHELARAFRAGDPVAFTAVTELVTAALARGEAGPTDGGILVPVPGHRAGAGNPACERLAVVLAGQRLGLSSGSGLLTRTADAPEAKDGAPREPAAEAGSLRWSPVPGTGPVVLLDDVVRTGSSLEAARLAAPPELRARLVALAVFRAGG